MQAKFEQKADFAGKKKPAKKQKAKKVLVKQEERELGWGGFDDVAPPTRTTVVLKNVFAPRDFMEDVTLRDDLESDMAGECGKLGALLAELAPDAAASGFASACWIPSRTGFASNCLWCPNGYCILERCHSALGSLRLVAL